MFVCIDDHFAFARFVDVRDNLVFEFSTLDGICSALMAEYGQLILFLSGDVVLGGEVVTEPSLPPPSPRRPSSSDPQHLIEPLSNNAQVKPCPRASEIAWRPLPRELIVVGEF